MVAGYHLIWTVYGYWLPNDPRGSTSTEIRVEPIEALGELHYGRKPVQPSSKEIREFHKKAHDILKHPVLTFDDEEIALVGNVLGQVIAEKDYTCYACAVMPDHVHMVVRRHMDWAENMIALFQQRSRQALIDAGKRNPTHPVWTKGPGWKTFINSQRQFKNEIGYVGQNPRKIGRPDQTWDFVTVYDGWMPE
jgi:REP element-mobilizing transposase RayT